MHLGAYKRNQMTKQFFFFKKKKCEDVLEPTRNQNKLAEDETKMKGARRVSSLQRNDINFSL